MTRSDPQLPDADAEHTVAAIDLGTQTALLTIVRYDRSGGMDVVEDHAFAARLGSGLSPQHTLGAEARRRTLDILATFARRIGLHGVSARGVRAVSTAVLRRASDAADFVEEVRELCGLKIEVIDSAEEARLAWLGATGFNSATRARHFDALVDVGGGSAELVGPGGGFIGSVDLGAAWLTERFASDPNTGAFDTASWSALEEYVRRGLVSLATVDARAAVLVGGGAVNLGCLVQRASAFDHRVAEGTVVHPSAALEIARSMARLSLEERYELPIEPDRAAALPAGIFVIGALLEHIGGRPAVVTGRGLRHGVALELVQKARGSASGGSGGATA